MDVTPSAKCFDAMNKFVDAFCGEAPAPMDVGPGAAKVRNQRRAMMDFLHTFAALNMREGVNRAVIAAKARTAVLDSEDVRAMDQARDDAVAGRRMVPSFGRRLLHAVTGHKPVA